MRFCKSACGVVCAFLLVAATAARAEMVLVNGELLEKSGIAHEIRGLANTMQSGIDEAFQNGADIDAKFLTAMRESIPVAYRPDEILQFLDKGLEELLTASEKRELLSHYDTPLGKRITELEKAAVHANAEIKDFAAKPQTDTGRVTLYKKMDDAVGLTSTGVTIAMSMSVALQAGLLSAADGPERVDIEALKAVEEKQRAQLTAATQKEVMATLAYAYRDLSNEDLTSYVAVLESPAGRKFSRGLGRLLAEALAEHAKELGQLIFTNLQTRKTT